MMNHSFNIEADRYVYLSFRPLNSAPDTSAPPNDFKLSWYIVNCKDVYLLKSDFQPEKGKERVLNRTKQ